MSDEDYLDTLKETVDSFIKNLSIEDLEKENKITEFFIFFEKDKTVLSKVLVKFKNEKINFIQILLTFLTKKPQLVLSILNTFVFEEKEEEKDLLITSLIFNSLVKSLEQLENTNLIEPILDLLEIISKENQNILLTKFKIIIDLLLGVYLNHNLSNLQKKRIKVTFQQFEPLMNSNEEFTKNLIEKLLLDMKLTKDEKESFNILTCFIDLSFNQTNKINEKLLLNFQFLIQKYEDSKQLFWNEFCEFIFKQEEMMMNQFDIIFDTFIFKLKKSLPQNYIENLKRILKKKELKFEEIKKLLNEITLNISLKSSNDSKILIMFGEFFIFLFSNFQHFQKDILKEFFNLLPEYPNLKDFSTILSLSEFNENQILFNTGMLLYILTEPIKFKNDLKLNLIFDLFNISEIWISFSFYSTNNCISFLEMLRHILVEILNEMKSDYIDKFDVIFSFFLKILNGFPKNEIKIEILNWFEFLTNHDEPIQNITDEINHIIFKVSNHLIKMKNDKNEEIRKLLILIFSNILNHLDTISDLFFEILNFILLSIGDINQNVSSCAIDCLSKNSFKFIDGYTWNDFQLWRQIHFKEELSSKNVSNFDSRNLNSLLKIFRGESNNFIYFDLEKIFFNCNSNQNYKKQDEEGRTFPIFSKILLEKWICIESSKYVVQNKLRTSIGGPMQMFEFFEKLLNFFCSKLKENELKFKSESELKFIKRINLFLNFLEELNKQINLANENDSKYYSNSISSFFKTNKKVCDDWFNRLRNLIISISELLNFDTSFIKNSYLKLKDLKLQLQKSVNKFNGTNSEINDLNLIFNQFEISYLKLLSYLSKIGEYDQIHGLNSWISGTFSNLQSKNVSNIISKKIIEIKKVSLNLELESIGSFEMAIEDYLQKLKDESYLEKESNDLIFNQILNSYKSISDFESLNDQLKKNENLNQFFKEHYSNSYSEFLLNYDSKEKINFKKVEKFESIIDFSKFEILKNYKLQKEDGMDNIKFQLGNYISDNQFSSSILIVPALSQLHIFKHLNQSEDEDKKDEIKIPKVEQKLTRIQFLNDLKTFGTLKNDENLIKVVSIEQCKILSKKKNDKISNSILSSISNLISSDELLYQKSKILLQNEAKEEEGIEILCKLIFNLKEGKENNLLSKIYFDLENWISKDIERRGELVELQLKVEKEQPIKSIQEYLISKSINFSNNQQRNPLIRFGNLLIQKGNELSSNKSFDYSKENIERLSTYLNDDLLSEEDLKNMLSFLNEIRNEDNFKKEFELQYPYLRSKSNNLCSYWLNLKKEMFHNYSKGIDCYFKALKITNSNEKYRENNVMMTLKILKLFVEYPIELKNEIENGISNSKLHIWIDIIPQLLSYLNMNSNEIVVKIISNLLIKIGKTSPEILCYPLIVGSISKSKQFENVISKIKEEKNDIFKNVEVIIKELSRLTIFYEEMCYNNLYQILKKFKNQMNQFHLFEDKIEKSTNQNSTEYGDVIKSSIQKEEEKEFLKNGKYNQLFSPIIIELEKTISLTVGYPETRHEFEFQEKYENILIKMVEKLKNLKDFNELNSIYDSMNSLMKSFLSVYKKKNLNLKDISPILSKLEFENVPIPGVEITGGGGSLHLDESINHDNVSTYSTILKFNSSISILPSKTKPKKISLLSSNGDKITFLIKGTEDLHLDERIMQFLKIINLSLLHSKDTRNLRARNYSVIPLGERTGLIKWVDEAIPLYSTYKNWFQNNSKVSKQIQKPMDLYYKTLVPFLKEKGINSFSHQNIPKDILMNVLKKLMNEHTPKNLISKEIWYQSKNLPEWFNKSKTFNRSIGVMSIIGYCIGLGDRHCDNILIDYSTGEIVHIDYNICFDKGKKLKIPEVVPFRLTPILHNALGITGVEGLFKLSCEETLGTMKRSKDTLLMLLDAFVRDPLVDWSTDKDKNDLKDLELKVSFNLFTSRLIETEEFRKNVFRNFDSKINEIEKEKMEITNYIKKYSKDFNVYFNIQDSIIKIKDQLNEKENELNKVLKPFKEIESNFLETSEDSKRFKNLLKDQYLKFKTISENNFNGYQGLFYSDLIETLKIDDQSYFNDFNSSELVSKQSKSQDLKKIEKKFESLIQERKLNFDELILSIEEYKNFIEQFFDINSYYKMDKSFEWTNILSNLLNQYPISSNLFNSSIKLLEKDEKKEKENILKIFKLKFEKIQKLNLKLDELKENDNRQDEFKQLLDDSIKKVHEFITTDSNQSSSFLNFFVIFILEKVIEKLKPDEDSLESVEQKWFNCLQFSISSLKSMKILLNLNSNLNLSFNQLLNSFENNLNLIQNFMKEYNSLFNNLINFIKESRFDWLIQFNQFLKLKKPTFSEILTFTNKNKVFVDLQKQFGKLNSIGFKQREEEDEVLKLIIEKLFKSSIQIFKNEEEFDEFDILEMKNETLNIFESFINSNLIQNIYPKLIKMTENFKEYFSTNKTQEDENLKYLIQDLISFQYIVDEMEEKEEKNDEKIEELKIVLSNILKYLIKYSWMNYDLYEEYEEIFGKQNLESLNLKSKILKRIENNLKKSKETFENLNKNFIKYIQMEGKTLRNKNEKRNSIIQSKLSIDELFLNVCNSIIQIEEFISNNEITNTMQNHILSTIKKYKNSINFELEYEFKKLKQKKDEIESKMKILNDEIENLKMNFSTKGSNFTKIIFEYEEVLLDKIKSKNETEEVLKYFDVLNELKSLIDSILKITNNFKQLKEFDLFISNHLKNINQFFDALNNKNIQHFDLKNIQSSIKHIENEINLIILKNDSIQQQVEEVEDIEEEEIEEEVKESNDEARNYAIDVLKRVEKRLNSKYSIQNQVNQVIQESTNLDNLSMMYEGWMAWI
eukprot:gene2892-4735_t